MNTRAWSGPRPSTTYSGRPWSAGLRVPGVEVDGGDERLHGVGEDRGLLPAAGGLLSLAHPQIGPKVEGAGHRGELLAADRRRPDLGELAFRIAGVGGEQELGDGQAQDGVAQELEALVVAHAGVFGGIRAVGQRLGQQLPVGERVAERLFERLGVSHASLIR